MTDGIYQPVTASIVFDVTDATASAYTLIQSMAVLDDELRLVDSLTKNLQSSIENTFGTPLDNLINSLKSAESSLDLTLNKVLQIRDSTIDIYLAESEYVNQSRDLLDSISKRVELEKIASDALKFELDTEEQLAIAESDRITKAQEYADYVSLNQRQAIGYGQGEAGMIGPEPPPSDDGSGSQSGIDSIGGRGFSTAGSLLRDLGLGEIGKAVADTGKVITSARLADRLVEVSGGFEALAPALGLATIAIAAIAVGVYEFNQTIAPTNALLLQGVSSLDTYYKTIETGTTRSINTQIAALESQQANAEQKTSDLQNVINNSFSQNVNLVSNSIGPQFADLGARLITAGENSGILGSGIKGLNDDLIAAKKSSTDLAGQIEGLKNAENSAAVAFNNVQQQIQSGIQWDIQRGQLIEDGTQKQVEAVIDKNKNEIQAYQNAIDKEKQLAESAIIPYDKAQAKIIEYQIHIDDLNNKQSDLTNTVLVAAEANDKYKASFQGIADLAASASKELDDLATLSKTRDANQVSADDKYYTAANDAYTAYQTQRTNKIDDFNNTIDESDAKQAQKQTDGKNKLTDQINAIQTKADDEVAKLKTDQSTKEQQITTALADKKQEIENNLSDKIQSIAIDLANKISDIKNKANQDEIDAAYNLDARKIADIQRKEATDIANAEKDSSRKDDTAKKDEQKQIEAAQVASDKQKEVLEKDNELKIRQIEAQASKEESAKLAQGTQALAIQQAQYDAERTQKIDDFNKKLAEEDDRNKVLAQQRYDAWIKEKDAIDKKYDDQKLAIEKKYDDQNEAIKTKLDGINFTIGGKLNDQGGLYTSHFGTLISTQTTKQSEIEKSWGLFFDNLNSKLGVYSTPSTAGIPSGISTSYNGISDTVSNLAAQNYSNNYANFAGYTGTSGDVSLAIGGQLDAALNLSSANKSNNYSNFAGYNPNLPQHASGLDRVPRDNYIASLHADEKVLNKQEADAYRSGGNTSQGHTITFNDGAIVVNGTNLSKEELKDAMIEALSDKMKEFIGS